MKYYSKRVITNYVNAHKDEIKDVTVGMEEDWFWTAEIIYDNVNGFYDVLDSFEEDSDLIEVAGICGSSWATPVMRVSFLDGTDEVLDCWKDDHAQEDKQQIAKQKAFALVTGGMDSVYESM